MNDHTHKPADTELTLGALVECPTCGVPAEITDRFTLGGAPGPVEHVKVVCVRRHWYTLPVDSELVRGMYTPDGTAGAFATKR
jgi:hypothetical protein